MVNYDLEEVLPHKHPMILIDDVVEYDLEKQTLTAEFKVFPKKVFFDKTNDGINSLVGIEVMAQAIGCYSYFRNNFKKPECGLLLGTRLFNNSLDFFKNGETYYASVHEIFTDAQISAFDCIVKDKNGNELQSAGLNVCQVDDVEGYLKNENG